jgi:hypothetical protein
MESSLSLLVGVLPKCEQQGNDVHERIDGGREFAGYGNFSCCCGWSRCTGHSRAPAFGQHAVTSAATSIGVARFW